MVVMAVSRLSNNDKEPRTEDANPIPFYICGERE